jgi:hypothetical protein
MPPLNENPNGARNVTGFVSGGRYTSANAAPSRFLNAPTNPPVAPLYTATTCESATKSSVPSPVRNRERVRVGRGSV